MNPESHCNYHLSKRKRQKISVLQMANVSAGARNHISLNSTGCDLSLP